MGYGEEQNLQLHGNCFLIVNNGINRDQLQDIYVTTDIIAQCIKRLKSDGVAGQMERYAGWWTKRAMIGLPPQTREWVDTTTIKK